MITPDENDVEDLARRILKAASARARAARPQTPSTSTRACSHGRRSVHTSRPACSGSSTCSRRARRRRTCSTISTSTSSPTTRPASCAPGLGVAQRDAVRCARGACRVRGGIRRMAGQFIGGASPADRDSRHRSLERRLRDNRRPPRREDAHPRRRRRVRRRVSRAMIKALAVNDAARGRRRRCSTTILGASLPARQHLDQGQRARAAARSRNRRRRRSPKRSSASARSSMRRVPPM